MYRKMLSIMLIDVLQMLSWLKCNWQGILNLRICFIFFWLQLFVCILPLYLFLIEVEITAAQWAWFAKNLLYGHRPSCVLFFGEWSFHFFLLNKCKRVCWRYQERITKGINFNFDVLTTTICSFLIPAITSLLNDIMSSVCNWDLMVMHRTDVFRLQYTFSNMI